MPRGVEPKPAALRAAASGDSCTGTPSTLCSSRPDLAARTMAIARQLLPDAGPGFRRRSCCLYYRTTPAGAQIYCGDCILGTSPAQPCAQ